MNLIAKIAILGAIAVIVMLFEVAIPFFPPFYKLGLDEVIVMIGGFRMAAGHHHRSFESRFKSVAERHDDRRYR